MICDFAKDLEFSFGFHQVFDIQLIKEAIPNCKTVEKTPIEIDRKGIDYIATLEGGAKIFIDAKTRRKGKIKNKHDPELALEWWSICPSNTYKGKPGWTWNQENNVDMILYTFDPEDTNKFYLVPFQHLRMAFQHHYKEWSKTWKPRFQPNKNGNYFSKAMFVPASVILNAVMNEMARAY